MWQKFAAECRLVVVRRSGEKVGDVVRVLRQNAEILENTWSQKRNDHYFIILTRGAGLADVVKFIR